MSGKAIAISRGVAVIGGTAALMIAATFAAFTTNQVTLAGNVLSVDGNQLQIFDIGSSTWVTATNGYSFTLNPGVESTKQPFYLKNNSGASLGIAAQSENTPNFTAGVNLSKVTVFFYDSANNLLASTDMATLAAPLAFGGPLLPAASQGNYQISFEIAPDGFTGTSATINNINIGFTGTSSP